MLACVVPYCSSLLARADETKSHNYIDYTYMVVPGQLVIGEDGMPTTLPRNDDLVSACRKSFSLRSDELEAIMKPRTAERQQEAYPVQAAEQPEPPAVDFAAQFRAARARVAEEERQSKAKAVKEALVAVIDGEKVAGDREAGATSSSAALVGVSTSSPSFVSPCNDADADVNALCVKCQTTPAGLVGLPKLRAEHRGLGPAGARGLAVLIERGTLGALQVLALSQNAFGDTGIAVLADSLRPSAPLLHLDLASNSFSEAGATAMARALGRGDLPWLVTLSLKNNDIDSKGLAAIGAVKHDRLNWLNLSGRRPLSPASFPLCRLLLLPSNNPSHHPHDRILLYRHTRSRSRYCALLCGRRQSNLGPVALDRGTSHG